MNLNNYPLWTALVTPMNADASVNYDDLGKLLREQEEARNALLILGSTGESLNLDEGEKKNILKFVLDLKLKVPLMVGVGGIHLGETRSWIEYLNGLAGLGAYLLVTPLYAKPGEYGQYEWFKTLMDMATRPVMLYNIPSRTGVELAHGCVKKLANHPKFWAIKESSGQTSEFSEYSRNAPRARLYSGDDALLPSFAPLGAKGLVSVASNVWPVQTALYVRQNLGGTLVDKALWDMACRSLFMASNPVPVKALLAKLGRIKHPTLRSPLNDRDMVGLENVLREHENIVAWGERQ